VKRFALAPMSRLIRGLTIVLLAIPVVFIALPPLVPWPRGAESLFGIIGVLLVVLYAAVWLLWRPMAFEIGPRHLTLVFPLWRREILRDDIVAATALELGQFKARYGCALRVGVGGLWGGFGWLWTSRRGFIGMYVSRTDGIVLVERRTGRDLLITPERPGDFVAALTGR
jgi:hypothetical protein